MSAAGAQRGLVVGVGEEHPVLVRDNRVAGVVANRNSIARRQEILDLIIPVHVGKQAIADRLEAGKPLNSPTLF